MIDIPLSEEWEKSIQKFSLAEVIGFYRHEKLKSQRLAERITLLQTTLDRIVRIAEFLKVVD